MYAKHSPGPWFVSGARFRMNGGEWHSIDRFDGATKDVNIACVGFDPRTGDGWADACLIAAAPHMLEALRKIADGLTPGTINDAVAIARAAIARAEGRS